MYKTIITVAADHVLEAALRAIPIGYIERGDSVIMVLVLVAGWTRQRVPACILIA